jgi:hypothetical protein
LGQLEQSDDDVKLEVEDVLDILRTPVLFLGEQRVMHGDRPSKAEESLVLFENKFMRANLVTIGILIVLSFLEFSQR